MDKGIERGQDCLDKFTATGTHAALWQYPDPIGADEWLRARPAPDCIVENYLYADVALLIAPGGTGKTTLILYESIHIVLGLDLWGLKIRKPGPVLIISAEDTRESLVARLRAIVSSMGLSEAQLATVRAMVRISDVSGMGCRLTAVVNDMVLPNYFAEEIIQSCRHQSPVMIVIDPAVSFGVGESRINDAEQGLVEAARLIRRALNCCVRYVHHTGKQNAREKTLDQYSGRNGSAFADGARMVSVMQGGYTPAEWSTLTGHTLDVDEHALLLARPKLSFAPPQEHLYIVRDGYQFNRVLPMGSDRSSDLEAINNQVWQLLTEELKNGRRHTRNTLEALSKTSGLKRQEIRDAVSLLLAAGRVESREWPNARKGGAHRYLQPIASPELIGEPILKVVK